MVSSVIASTAHALLIPENASVRLEEWDRDVIKLVPMVTLDRTAVSCVAVMETCHAILRLASVTVDANTTRPVIR